MLYAVEEVHAKEAGNQCGEHEHDADGGHGLHHGVSVVVDDAGVGVHCGVEDVGVDVSGLAGLVHLDGHVLNEVGVQLIDGQLELELGE